MPPVAGGATEKSWHELSLEFARLGHNVTVISRRHPGWPDREIRDGVKHARLCGYAHTKYLSLNLCLDFLWSLRVTRALPSADVTVSNCIALPLWLGWIRRAGKVVVMTGRLPKGQYRWYRRIDQVLASSSMLESAVLAENPRLAGRIKVCGYPIGWAALSPSRGSPRPAGPLTLGYVGRIHREKGLDILVAALADLTRRPGLPAWRVVLCGPQSVAEGGSGEDYARTVERSLTAWLPPGTCELLPPVFAPARLAEVYRKIDVFCYPSVAIKGETFGVAVAEAMAAGAVPVVSDLPCFADFVRPGRNGLVFEHGAPDRVIRLADCLEQLLQDGALRARLAAQAVLDSRRFDYPVVAKAILDDFERLD